jgi:hypothetical protein
MNFPLRHYECRIYFFVVRFLNHSNRERKSCVAGKISNDVVNLVVQVGVIVVVFSDF